MTATNKCIKDLENAIEDRPLNRCLVLDYKPQNVAFCMNNSLIVVHWNGQADDRELEGIGDYLCYLGDEDNPA